MHAANYHHTLSLHKNNISGYDSDWKSTHQSLGYFSNGQNRHPFHLRQRRRNEKLHEIQIPRQCYANSRILPAIILQSEFHLPFPLSIRNSTIRLHDRAELQLPRQNRISARPDPTFTGSNHHPLPQLIDFVDLMSLSFYYGLIKFIPIIFYH